MKADHEITPFYRLVFWFIRRILHEIFENDKSSKRSTRDEGLDRWRSPFKGIQTGDVFEDKP